MTLMTSQTQELLSSERRHTWLEQARLHQLAWEATANREHAPAHLARLIHELLQPDQKPHDEIDVAEDVQPGTPSGHADVE